MSFCTRVSDSDTQRPLLFYTVLTVIRPVPENVLPINGYPLYNMSSMYRFDCYHETFLRKSSDDLFRLFEIFVSEDDKRLTSIYLLPKLHKNQTKAKLMIPALTCFVKPLSKYITSAFKFILNQVNSYNNQRLYFSGVNSF